ncbi:MAG: hypothetical protein ACKO0V_03365, partial [bacterium]
NNQPSSDPEVILKNLRIVRAALISGPFFFMCIVLLFLAKHPLKYEAGVLFFVAIFMSVPTVLLALLSGQLLVKKPADWDQLSDDQRRERLPAIAFTAKVLQGALLEGPTFFWILLVLIDGNAYGLIFGSVLIALAISLFPTNSRFNGLIDELNERFRI